MYILRKAVGKVTSSQAPSEWYPAGEALQPSFLDAARVQADCPRPDCPTEAG